MSNDVNRAALLLTSQDSSVGNLTVSGNLIGDGGVDYDYGVLAWNNAKAITVSGGSINGVNMLAGVRYEDSNATYGPASFVAGGVLTVDGVSITNAPIGIQVDSSVGSIDLPITTTGTTITGGTTGMLLSGAGVQVVGNTLGNLTLNGQSGDYITLANGALDDEDIDGSGLTLDGNLVSGMTMGQLFDAEDKITDELDDNSLGLIVLAANTIFVTPASSPTASDNDYTRIRNAVEAVSDGWTIWLGPNALDDATFNWDEPLAAASWRWATTV